MFLSHFHALLFKLFNVLNVVGSSAEYPVCLPKHAHMYAHIHNVKDENQKSHLTLSIIIWG